jgi:hypothetical protein
MRILAVIVLLLVLLILLGMSFLRINNLEHDVSVLRKQVEQLKTTVASPAVPATAPLPIAQALTPVTPAAGTTVPSPAATLPIEGAPPRFLDDGAEQQAIALPVRLPRARVSILAIEGDGAPARPLAEPISFVLQAGIPQEVQGICQGPETAAWVFLLEPAALRITSRDCEYPVRGLRPRVRISAVP